MNKKTRRKWAAAIPFIVLIIYVLLAYCLDNFTDYEHPYTISLLVFLIVLFDNQIVGLEKFKIGYPLLVLIIYIVVSIFTHLWHPLWVIFITIPIYYIFFGDKKIGELRDKNKNKDIDYDADDD